MENVKPGDVVVMETTVEKIDVLGLIHLVGKWQPVQPHELVEDGPGRWRVRA